MLSNLPDESLNRIATSRNRPPTESPGYAPNHGKDRICVPSAPLVPAGMGEAGAGTPSSATPAASPGAGVRQLPGQGAQVEHHPGSWPHLHRTLPSHREGGAGPAVRRTPGSVLPGPPGGTDGVERMGWNGWGGTDGTYQRRTGGPGRLSPHHRLAGAQARGFRPLPVPGADVSHHKVCSFLPDAGGAARAAGCSRACHNLRKSRTLPT